MKNGRWGGSGPGIFFRATTTSNPRASLHVANSPFTQKALQSTLCGALLFLAACAATELPSPTTDINSATTVADWSAFTIGPNDLVHISVLGQPDYSPPAVGVRVAPDGTLSLPALGSVAVAGKSAAEVASFVEAGLKKYLLEPSVSVAVLEQSSRRFYVFGDVNTPGPFVMDRPITALEALAHGGGLVSGANGESVVIIRAHGEDIEVIPFNAETPGPDGLVQVLPDDFVFVSKAGVGVFSESVLPYLQGIGFTVTQVSSVALAYDRIYND
jgi:protein involved in polysaccharide export with SLBB domain